MQPNSFFPRQPLFDLLFPLSQPDTSLLLIPCSSAPSHHPPPHAATISLLLSSHRWGHCYFARQIVNMSFNAMGNFQEMKQDSPEKSTPSWSHPQTSFFLGSWSSAGEVPCACRWFGEFLCVSRSCNHTLQPKQGKGLGTKRECRVQGLNWEALEQTDEFSSYTSASAATGRQTGKPTHPSQCRDTGGKSSAQRRLKVPAVCTGTCLPPAASSSLQPHSTASSRRPNGSWVIPVTEKSTAQSNATGTENKRILTQKIGSPSYSCSSKKELAKLIMYFITEWTYYWSQ